MSASPTEGELIFLENFCKERGIRNVIEFGPGKSTEAFARAGCHVHSYEPSELYFFKYRRKFNGMPNIEIRLLRITGFPLAYPIGWKDMYDFAFVDSPVGASYKYFSRLDTVLHSLTIAPLIGLHDAKRRKEKNTLDILAEIGWNVIAQSPEEDTRKGIVILEKK